MLENCKSAQERWGGVSEIIDRWLQNRQQLLVQYCQLSDLMKVENQEACASVLQHFSQLLVDYVSAGHFEVYDQLVKEGQEFNDTEGLKKAGEAYKIIDPSTEFVLDFNDKYQETDDLETISKDLSELGEILVNRFEAEDSMIEALHTSHQDQIAS